LLTEILNDRLSLGVLGPLVADCADLEARSHLDGQSAG
jgi:hypothetical protein